MRPPLAPRLPGQPIEAYVEYLVREMNSRAVEPTAVVDGGTGGITAAEARTNIGLGHVHTGAGSPEGVLTAAVGSLYSRTDGGASTTLYVKESGAGNTGWVAK